MKTIPQICIQQSIIPDYRMGLFHLLQKHWGEGFQVFGGDADFGGTPVSSQDAWDSFQRVNNRYLLGGRALWQWGCFWKLLRADTVVFNGNMRVVSNIPIVFFRKLLGRRTILWGHAFGQSRLAALLRNPYLRFCDGFIAYTESQGNQLRTHYPWLKVWVAANSCVSLKDCVPVEGTFDEVDSILYVGRLVEAKKVQLLLEGFRYGREQGLIPESMRLVYVGDGAERARLESRSLELGVSDRVEFVGHISDVSQLREYYGRAICSVSPGYVGLSATQSFSFGVPMLIARDEFHSPEIEACQEGVNSGFFASDSVEDLAKALKAMVVGKSEWLARRKDISEWTASNYSFEVMRDAFVAAVEDDQSGGEG